MAFSIHGMERTQEQLAALFEQADLRLGRVVTPPGTLSIVEAVAA